MKKRGKNFIFIVIAILLIAGVVAYFYLTPEEKTDEFDVGAILLKTAIKENGLLLKSVKLTNNGADDVFKISTTLQDFVSPIENEIFLKSGESKEIEIKFEDKAKAGPGVFTGELIVSSTTSSKKVPVILEIESEDPFFDININVPIKYEEVHSNSKFVAEVKIFNLENLDLKDVKLEYFVKDFGNNILLSESENIIVERQASSLNKANTFVAGWIVKPAPAFLHDVPILFFLIRIGVEREPPAITNLEQLILSVFSLSLHKSVTCSFSS